METVNTISRIGFYPPVRKSRLESAETEEIANVVGFDTSRK